VGAWIRLRIPPPAAPLALTKGPPPPLDPPLPELKLRPVPTDPRPKFYVLEEELPDGVLTLTWNAEEPDHLVAELRVPSEGRHVSPEAVARFWASVKRLVTPLSPVRVEASDPAPPKPA
jgi:hypothetical protein